jgi:hypothetical protein
LRGVIPSHPRLAFNWRGVEGFSILNPPHAFVFLYVLCVVEYVLCVVEAFWLIHGNAVLSHESRAK